MARKPNARPGGGGGILGHAGPSDFYKKDKAKTATVPAGLAFGEMPSYDGADRSVSGTSIFDPVLCEIVYRWFSPPDGTVLDPFAGGSVRGIVAAKLGRRYIGHELRAEQVAANREQGAKLCADDDYPPEWICGDSRTIDRTCADLDADLVFTCPPYADLEVYSDDPLDLSTMDYPGFKAAYFEIIRKACDRLKPDSFACCVVGEVRDKNGNYLDFVGDTVQAFRDAGLEYYNEAILVTAVGSLPIRAGRQFSTGRKLGKTHQNVLVFVKGNGKRAAEKCGPVIVDEAMLCGSEDEKPPPASLDVVPVKVSSSMARLRFAGCDPEYIRTTCHASCCQSSTAPGGTMITIHPSETRAIEARGGVVVNGLLQSVNRRCPFKTKDELCGLHFTEDKPFGCIASPFTLNASGTLIVRNRYKMLKCFNDGLKLPAYKAFRASLNLIFGDAEAERICHLLDNGSGDVIGYMPRRHYMMLNENDDIKRQAGKH